MDSSSHAKLDQPCAACRMLHRKCSGDCILAPHFPAQEPEKFSGVHKVFGASNITKMLQMVNESEREDTVKGLVYEANMRIRDPVYGCTANILYLQERVRDLELQLETTRRQSQESQEQRNQLLSILLDVPDSTTIHPVDNGLFSIDKFIHGSSAFALE